jgi:2-desacetyl-2-hydroxyethyl bacteriochlorophyllide A dehydrogenase
MRSAVFPGPGRLEIVTRETPLPAEGSVLVRVEASGVCGTDLHIFDDAFPGAVFPLVGGHEFAGVIEAVGPDVPHLRAGDHVAVDPNMYCGSCRPCRRGLGHLCLSLAAIGVTAEGGFATHCVVPARQAYKLPQDLPLHVAALTEPLSCCVHGIEKAEVRPGDVVVILGAGMIGLILLQLARLRGAATVIVSEFEPAKRAMAAALGATAVVDPRESNLRGLVDAVTSGGGADVVIECVGGQETAQQAISLVGDGGTVLFFGVAPESARVAISPYDVYRRELRIVGSFTNPSTFDAAIALLCSGRVQVEQLITHRLPLEGLRDGLHLLASRQAMKVLIEPSG